jgi:hypothetical protein
VLVKYNPNQSKAWQVSGVPTFDLDSNDNPWVFTYRKFEEIELSDMYLVMLDSSTGAATSNKIVPTNFILQSNEIGLLEISENNDFIIAGLLYNEAEFGNIKLSMYCPGDYMALQHYIARAKEGWRQDRKNLSSDGAKNDLAIELYPNPTEGILYIKNPEEHQIERIEIFDMLGRQQAVDWSVHDQVLSLHTLPSGSYLIRISTLHHTITTNIHKQ